MKPCPMKAWRAFAFGALGVVDIGGDDDDALRRARP